MGGAVGASPLSYAGGDSVGRAEEPRGAVRGGVERTRRGRSLAFEVGKDTRPGQQESRGEGLGGSSV